MNRRKNQCAHDGKKRHGLCRAVDGRSPPLSEEKKDGRNERSSVTNSNPKNEIDYREAPTYRIIQPPHADPIPEQVGDHDEQDQQKYICHAKRCPPRHGRLFLCVVRHQLGYIVKRGVALHQRILSVSRRVVTYSYVLVGRIHGRICLNRSVRTRRLNSGPLLNEVIMIRVEVLDWDSELAPDSLFVVTH